MSGTLQLGGTNLAVHSGSGASAKITLDSGLVFPAGHVVQVAVGSSSSARYETTNTAFHSITSTEDVATLTTIFDNSKFFLSMDISFALSGYSFIADFRRVVGGSTTQNISGGTRGVNSCLGDGTRWLNLHCTYLDAPNLSAGTEVKYGLSGFITGGTLYLNDGSANTKTKIVVMEVKA